jgi:hypothetical protein
MSTKIRNRIGNLLAAAMISVLCTAALIACVYGPAPLTYSTPLDPP